MIEEIVKYGYGTDRAMKALENNDFNLQNSLKWLSEESED